jgi:hypothetical protein
MGGNHFGAFGDFNDALMDEDSDFDFSGSESNIQVADPEDGFLSGFWGAAATMSMTAIPFLIGGDSAPTDLGVGVDHVADALNFAEMGGDVGANIGVSNFPSPQVAQPAPAPQ